MTEKEEALITAYNEARRAEMAEQDARQVVYGLERITATAQSKLMAARKSLFGYTGTLTYDDRDTLFRLLAEADRRELKT